MLKVVLTDRAELSLQEIIHHYLMEYSESRATKVIESIDQAFDRIAKRPLAYPICFDLDQPLSHIRQIIVHNTFKLIYRIQTDKIEVIEIFHGSRDKLLLKDIS